MRDAGVWAGVALDGDTGIRGSGAPVEVAVGPTVLPIPGLTRAKGRKERWSFEGQGLDLVVTPSSLGTSKAKLPGVGRHSFEFVAGLASDGAPPAALADCTVQLGDVFAAVLPGAAFRSKKGDFVLREPVGGVTTAIVSYAKERLTVKGRKADLGDVADGPATLLLVPPMGDDRRAVEVRAVRQRPGPRALTRAPRFSH